MNVIGLYSKQNRYTGLPQYYDYCKGAYIWSNGKKYLDMSYMGIGCNILGYNDGDTNRAVRKAIIKGSNSTLVAEEEKTLSALLFKEHPNFNSVRYARTGGEALKIAVDLGKAWTNKKEALRCGYHGWHIENENIKQFEYNNIDSFKKLFSKKIGVVIMEIVRNITPDPKVFQAIRDICTDNRVILIFDEITSGYRFNAGGFYQIINAIPDMVVFGKGISNGYPFSCILGHEALMQCEKFISSTYFTDRLSCAAVIATITKLKKQKYNYLLSLGKTIMTIWTLCSMKTGIKIKLNQVPQLAHFEFDDPKKDLIKTIFVQELLKYGILAANSFYPSFAHRPKHLKIYLKACMKSFKKIANNIDHLDDILEMPIIQERPVKITT